MLTARIILFIGFFISLASSSCQEQGKKPQSPTLDSIAGTTVDTTITGTAADSTKFTFNPENEFLGLGVPQFGDLDSMIARRRIRALVPYTHLYYYIDGKERRGIAFEALNLFEKSLNEQLQLKRNGVQ